MDYYYCIMSLSSITKFAVKEIFTIHMHDLVESTGLSEKDKQSVARKLFQILVREDTATPEISTNEINRCLIV